MSAQAPQNPLAPGLAPGLTVLTPQQPPPGQNQPLMGPQGPVREISPVYLCRIGQETVQDIVTRTMEIFQIARATQLPNGVTQTQVAYQDRFGKLQEHLRQLTQLFRTLRLLYERCIEMTVAESPAERVRRKNQEMKLLMEQMRNLLWDINAMLSMRR
ncbi:hypothetical protein DNTS_028759 [Danionella cerebrum]|uniref:Mediator of RNA polymerase II transcription subunit 30 n=1 Tax=Danionella cerebrum TaxID=2873325 RepID=A0A553QVB8_9TELE|nr:hypothetical protein DNTS_028759 [Danionella translucida]TRY93726.1 hypothetical protein DNTS_028759 [Danionella translucida]